LEPALHKVLLEEPAVGGLRAHLTLVPRHSCRGGSVELPSSLNDCLRSSLDHQAGFLLSRIDGVSTLDALLDVCAMPRPEALQLVAKLVRDGVLRLRKTSDINEPAPGIRGLRDVT